ncbi:dehydration-responsive element-binding protein 1D-like [Lycium barbarum]|uniref:dehydration-responsive element-binding protein 1D-like n=1 Tax=Lycium barbarum TaxID=112863 RepID=UPI00293EBE1D|nr:dehydration-responsive element-binding protein 1D-like [Lycium barbarum]
MNYNNTILCMSDANSVNLERDHLQETSSPSAQDEGVFLLASSRPKKRAGRKKFQETRHPIYRGVRRRNNNKWVCELREPSQQKRIWLGTYPTPEMAARAHDVAVLALRGNLATLNFADSRWQLPMPISKDPKELRQAALKAAEAFRQDPELVGVDYMNEKVNSSTEEVKYQEIVVGGANGSGGDFSAKSLSMDMENILCCNWGENNEMLEMEGWREKMAEVLLFSPTLRLGSYFSWDDMEGDIDVELSLWSYSI